MASKVRYALILKGLAAALLYVGAAIGIGGCSDEPKAAEPEKTAKEERNAVKKRMADTNYVNQLTNAMDERRKLGRTIQQARAQREMLVRRAQKELNKPTAMPQEVRAEWQAHPEKYPELQEAETTLRLAHEAMRKQHAKSRGIVRDRLRKDAGITPENLHSRREEMMKRRNEMREQRRKEHAERRAMRKQAAAAQKVAPAPTTEQAK